MQTSRTITALLGTGALALAILAGNPANADHKPIERPAADTGDSLPGKAALARFGDRLDEVAQRNQLSEKRLRSILSTDPTSWLDTDGRLFYRDPVPQEPGKESPSPRWAKRAVTAAAGPANELHSRPGAQRVIFLDFDGTTLTNTAWNRSVNVDPMQISPFDLDGSPGTWSTAEQDYIHEVWSWVAEDYAPFDVDVTTEDPGYAAINRSSSSDQQFGTRALMDPDDLLQDACNCGGQAYVGVYDETGSNHDYYQPAMIYTSVMHSATGSATAASHEVGHNLGLGHDGQTPDVGYYSGHGAWAPIMGTTYTRAISQFSRGEYANASNREDDFAVSNANGAPLRPDDHGDTPATASPLTPGSPAAGVISTQSDKDLFRLNVTSAGSYTATAAVAPKGANLDIALDLLDANGNTISSNNPPSGQSDAATATGLGAAITSQLQPGSYFLRINNTGYADPLTTGYSTYASRGQYTITVR